MVKKILLLGENALYERSIAVKEEETALLSDVLCDMEDTLNRLREKNGWGNAISAPLIGVRKRVIYFLMENEPVIMINPTVEFIGLERETVRERCFCFPMLEVNAARYKRCRVKFRDMYWNSCEMLLEGEDAALIQHETDHLDGVLALTRASGTRSLFYRDDEEE